MALHKAELMYELVGELVVVADTDSGITSIAVDQKLKVGDEMLRIGASTSLPTMRQAGNPNTWVEQNTAKVLVEAAQKLARVVCQRTEYGHEGADAVMGQKQAEIEKQRPVPKRPTQEAVEV